MTKSIYAVAAVSAIALVGGLTFASNMVSTPADAAPISHADAAHPAVIELYQSQGCSSCPPALAVLDQVANRPDVLALNFAVTYWDNLGWKDTYAKPAFTARQWEFSNAQGRDQVQTPQLIVNGRAAVLGSDKPEVERAIARFARPAGPEIASNGTQVTIAAAPTSKPATVWFVAYDPRTVQVPVRAGENGGRTLPHRNMVRQLTSIGRWSGSAATFAVPNVGNGLKRAVLVQAGTGGAIVAARGI